MSFASRRLAPVRFAACRALAGRGVFDPPGSFEYLFAVLERRVEQVGDAALPDSEVFEGERLGYWARRMKTLERKGRLPTVREERLEPLPGWRWVAGGVSGTKVG